MDRWQGRTALVTGASSGIGKEISVTLLKYGVNVVACARRVDALEAIREAVGGASGAGELTVVKCDLSKEEDILAMFEKIRSSGKSVDICVNNAGLGIAGNLSNGSTDQWRTMVNVNVLGLCICTRESLKMMKEKVDDGHVIHIASVLAHTIEPMASFYCATKHAVRAAAAAALF